MMHPQWLETPNQDTRPATKFICALQYNQLNFFEIRPALCQPKSGLVVTITLEFLDKYYTM
jgi:hypothetical protein